MPGFKTDIICTEIIGDKVHVSAYINWFLEDIIITADCIFPITVVIKSKKIDGIDRAVEFKQIKFDHISASCRWTLGDEITTSIKKKTENEINRI